MQNGPPEKDACVARRGQFLYHCLLCLGFWGMATGKTRGTLLLAVIAVFLVSGKGERTAVGIMGGAAAAAGVLLSVVLFPALLFQLFLILLKAALEVGIFAHVVRALVPAADRQAKFWAALWVVWGVCSLYLAWLQCALLLKGDADSLFEGMSLLDYCVSGIYFIISAFGAPVFLYNRYQLWRYLQ